MEINAEEVFKQRKEIINTLKSIDETQKEMLKFFKTIEERTLDGVDEKLYTEELEKDNFSPKID